MDAPGASPTRHGPVPRWMCAAAFDRLRRAPLSWRIVATQFGVVAATSVAAALLGAAEALSALSGGVAVAAPNGVLALAASRHPKGGARAGAARFLALAALKWALAGLLMAAALAFLPVKPLGFVAGLSAAAMAGALVPIWMEERS